MTSIREAALYGARIAFEELPVVDIGALVSADSKNHTRAIEQLGWAARNTGFAYVRNHGIDQQLLDDCLCTSREFFSLPLETKMRWHYSNGRNHSGYLTMDQEITVQEAGGDYKEGLDYFFELNEDDPDCDYPFYGGPNLWVNAPDGYARCLKRCFDALLDLNRALLDAMLMSAGLPAGAVREYVDKPIAVLSPRHYPPQSGYIDRAHLGANEHIDWCCCTVIAQDEVPGLQAMNRDGQWVDVPPIEGTLVLNLGELLSHWTNGRFVATRHRVINDTGKHRFSLPAFLSPNRNVEMRVLEPFCEPGMASRFEPTSVGEYFTRRHQYAEPTA